MEENDPRRIVGKVKSDYNFIAREWDLSRTQPSRLKLNLIGALREGMEILDVGCGNGLMVPFIMDKGAYYVGVDIAENLIDIARERYVAEIEAGRAHFWAGDATELPVKDEEFDFIISFAVLHHLPSEKLRKKFFEEIRRALRPNGKVKITVWNLKSDWVRNRFDTDAQLGGQESGDAYIPWRGTQSQIVNRYVHQFSKDELYKLAKEAGFSDIRVGCFTRAGEQAENGEETVLEMGG